MKRIVPSTRFRRAFRRYVRRHPELRQRIEVAIEQMAVDVFAPVLETHPLKGKLEGFQSCSCGYDCRILFRIEKAIGQFPCYINPAVNGDVSIFI